MDAIKEHKDKNYGKLREAIVLMSGKTPESPKDFENLSSLIHQRIGVKVHSFTLKRFWGYIERGNVNLATLDKLCQFVGYPSWTSFCEQSEEGKSDSCFICSNTLYTKTLTPGSLVILRWNPNREVIVRFKGDNLFMIRSSRNSKLLPQGTFSCSEMTYDQPLVLHNLLQGEMTVPCDYVCGRTGGVKFLVMKD